MDAGFARARSHGGLRVLWLIDSLTMGGAESLAAVFARSVTRDGRIEATIAYLKDLGGSPLESVLRSAGAAVTSIESRNLRDLGAFRRLVDLIRGCKPDVLHAHLTYASIFGALASKLTGTPLVATVHVPPSDAPLLSREHMRERLACRLLSHLGTTVAVSNAQRAAYVNRGLLDPKRTIVIHNGIETDAFAPANDRDRGRLRARFHLPADAVVLTSVAVLRDRTKGLHALLEAMHDVLASVPIRLLIVGDGPMRPDLERRAGELGLNNAVCWLGQRDDVASVLAGSDAFVLPTLRDQFPTVLLEAMAAALPVISTTVDGVPEIVEHERTGLLVPPENPASLTAAIERLVSDTPLRRRLGEAGRRRVRATFSATQWLNQLYDLYDAVREQPAAAAQIELARHAS